MIMKTRHRLTIVIALAVAASLTLVTASPLAARKGGPDEGEPTPYQVTMTLTGTEEGLATACTPIVMGREESRNGFVLEARDTLEAGTDLHLTAPSVGFDGCYLGTANGSAVNPGPSFLRMHFDREDALEKLTWHFDVEAESQFDRKGRPRGYTVTHKFALTSQDRQSWDPQSWDPESGGSWNVDGFFELWRYTNTDEGPTWELVGEPELHFTVEAAPCTTC